MIYESEKIWFQLKRLFILFPFALVFFIYLIYLCQYDLIEYILHRNDYQVLTAKVIGFEMYEFSTMRGDNHAYLSQIEIIERKGEMYAISRDKEDYIGKKIKIAINIQDPSIVRRIEWIIPKDGIWIITCGVACLLILLCIGKILSFFKLKKVFKRIDNEYLLEVVKKRFQSVDVNVNEKDVIVTKIERDANPMITMEITQIYCRLQKSGEIVKSPKMLGHTFLKEGDYIKLDNGIEGKSCINWAQYFM